MKLIAGGYLTFYTPDQRPDIDLPLKETVALRALLAEIGIPVAEIQLVVLNGQIVDLDQVNLKNQDEVKVFPGVDGG